MASWAWPWKGGARGRHHRLVPAVAAALIAAIVLLEIGAPANVVVAYGYVLPILLIATTRNRTLMALTIALCLAATYSGLLRPTKPGRFVSAVINRSVVAGVLIGVAYFALTREERKAREEAARAELFVANAQLAEVKDKLSRSERLAALGMLASSVAHEVGTPLHSIAWQVQSLSEDPRVTPDMRKTIEIIETELNRVVSFIREKLSATRFPKANHAPVELDRVVQSVVGLMKPGFVNKGVALKTDLGLRAAPIHGNEDQLRQVLVNVLTNALAATEAGGEVVIVLGRRAATLDELEERRGAGGALIETMVTLTVRDSGCGMSEEHVKQAFEPFFTTKSAGDGTGLGLYLSREIVVDHEGTLSIDSVVGRGTMIEIALPSEAHPVGKELDEQAAG